MIGQVGVTSSARRRRSTVVASMALNMLFSGNFTNTLPEKIIEMCV